LRFIDRLKNSLLIYRETASPSSTVASIAIPERIAENATHCCRTQKTQDWLIAGVPTDILASVASSLRHTRCCRAHTITYLSTTFLPVARLSLPVAPGPDIAHIANEKRESRRAQRADEN
jgi:hypothetical protein